MVNIKKVLLAIVGSLALIASLFVGAGSAQAAPTVPVGPGTGFSTDPVGVAPVNSCSITAVGRDSTGNLVAIGAGHCHRDGFPDLFPGTVGAPVYKTAGGQKIGVLTDNYAHNPGQTPPPNTELDYMVIDLDDNVVIPLSTSEDGNVTVHSFGTANTFQGLCKDGISTGFTCGLILGQSTHAYSSYAFSFGGDSGGATVRQGSTVLIGMVTGGNPWGPYIYNKIQPTLNAINSSGKIGAGFTLVP